MSSERPIISKAQFAAISAQAGAAQVEDGVYQALNDFCKDVTLKTVDYGILRTDADSERTLRVNRAIQGMEHTRMIPSGHYQ